MDFFRDSEKINDINHVFVIAEIGQNHQGDMNVAKELILTAKKCGADCAKFQKTCLKEKFTKSALEKPYVNKNSWGATYGEHKAFLEFSENQFMELQKYASEVGILFTASAMDIQSLKFLIKINVPFIKIGSGDANNLPLIEEAAKSKIPLIISTGMQDLKTVQEIYKLVSKHHKQFALLHCVSSYPTPYEEINLKVISLYKELFPDILAGYSGHELGTHVTSAAVALGAKIIERHITLDKTQKGSDHQCSLEPNEFKQLVKNIRDMEVALGHQTKQLQECEMACYRKLGKCLVYANNWKKGHILQTVDLKIKATGHTGIDGARLPEVVGQMLLKDVENDTPVVYSDLIKK